LAVEVDEERIRRRLVTRYVDRQAGSLDEALDLAKAALQRKEALSIALLGNAAEVLPRLAEAEPRPDLVTDQTSAHDLLNGYVPHGLPLAEAVRLRQSDPARYLELSRRSVAAHVRAMLRLKERGAVVFD